MNGGRYGGRSPPRPHLFGGLNFPVVSEEGNTSILRSNADQEQEEEPMNLKHKIKINIADRNGHKQEVRHGRQGQGNHGHLPGRHGDTGITEYGHLRHSAAVGCLFLLKGRKVHKYVI